MEVEIIRTFQSKKLGRIVQKDEILNEDPAWVNDIVQEGFGRVLPQSSGGKLTTKKLLKINGNKIETASLKVPEEPRDKIFLTGHKGYLGSYMYNLLKDTYDVVGFDVKEHTGDDLANKNVLLRKMQGCKYVIHSAAIPHPNLGTFQDYFRVNVSGTLNVMEAAALNKVYRVIYISSGGIYGWDVRGKMTPLYFPIDEKHPPVTVTGQFEGQLEEYMTCKFMAEQVVAYYGTNFFQSIVLRASAAVPQKKFFIEAYKKSLPDRDKTFWTNTEPETLAKAVKKAVEVEGDFHFEVINVVEKTTHPDVDLNDYLKRLYPDVPVKKGWKSPMSLLSTKKAKKVLGL